MKSKCSLLAALCLASALPVAAQVDYLLIPDSGNDRILKVDAFDGTILATNFIVDTALSTPIQAIPSGTGTFYVSDQVLDAVREYDASGAFVRTVTDFATSGIDNIRGIALHGGELFVTVGSGSLLGTIARIDPATGAHLGTFATLPGGGTAFDVHFRASDVLVSDIGGDDILRYDLAGALLGVFHTSDGTSSIDFPQQITERANGNVLVAGFSPPLGIYEFNSLTGATVATYTNATGNRGVYELGNGKILYTAGTQIRTVDPTNNSHTILFDQLAGGGLNAGSFRFIEPVMAAVPEPGSLALVALTGALGLGYRRRRV